MNLSRMLRELTRAHQAINDTDEPVMVGLQVVPGMVEARFYAHHPDRNPESSWGRMGRSVDEAVANLAFFTLEHARSIKADLTAIEDTTYWTGVSETVARLERVLDEEA